MKYSSPDNSSQKYRVIGLMSGTSLDGLDVAYCEFEKIKSGWRFQILNTQTKKYSTSWTNKLATASSLAASELLTLHNQYGTYLGEQILLFVRKNEIDQIDLIASHGHTVFHQPNHLLTFQLGNGLAIHQQTKIPVIWDFRSMDVLLGGQGAPLVPIGDKYLFKDYDICLNLGGIANLSTEQNANRIAFDICFVNQGLNYLARIGGQPFDKDGKLAASGHINPDLLSKLTSFYRPLRKKRPSLGREIFENRIMGILDNRKISLPDKARTFCQSVCTEIENALPKSTHKLKMLVTGGGAHNKFLMTSLSDHLGDKIKIELPPKEIINFKEALAFGFLGVLRYRHEINCLRSVTGASQDSSGGIMVGF